MRSRIMLIAALTMSTVLTLPPLDGQIVRGQVMDSIMFLPLSGSMIVLIDGAGADIARTVADNEGLFLINAPGPAQYRLRVESAGYRTSTFPLFALGSSEVKWFMLLIASVAPLPPAPTIDGYVDEYCAEGTMQPGQGVIVGIVRNAETATPVANASVLAWWPTVGGVLADLARGVDLSSASGETNTDSAGAYVACGVPVRTPLTFHAASGDLLSDFVELRFDSGGVFVDDDFHVTTQSVMRQDFDLMSTAQHTAAVAGTVEDAGTRAPLVGAMVEIVGTTLQTTTAANGTFTLRGLPAGAANLAVRHPGFRAAIRKVELTHGDTIVFAQGALRLDALPLELVPVVVEAERPVTRRPLAEFWERREAGGGAFITREEFENQGNPQKPTDVLRRMRGIRIRGNSNYGKPLSNVSPKGYGLDHRRVVIETGRGTTRSFSVVKYGCPPLLYLDLMYLGDATTVSIDDILPLVNIEAIEVYSSAATVPPQLNRTGSTCGVILFWTR